MRGMFLTQILRTILEYLKVNLMGLDAGFNFVQFYQNRGIRNVGSACSSIALNYASHFSIHSNFYYKLSCVCNSDHGWCFFCFELELSAVERIDRNTSYKYPNKCIPKSFIESISLCLGTF